MDGRTDEQMDSCTSGDAFTTENFKGHMVLRFLGFLFLEMKSSSEVVSEKLYNKK